MSLCISFLNDPCLYLCISTTRISLNKRSPCFSVHSNGDLFKNNKNQGQEYISDIYIYISGDFLGCHKFEGQKYFEFRK